MVKFNLRLRKLFLFVLLCAFIGSANAQNGSQCYKPLTGSGVGARAVQNGLICLLCNNGNNLDNLTDANRNNYVELNQLVGLLQGSGVSVVDSVNTYPAGHYAGYVVDIGSSLLTANVLNSFVVSTYNNGVLVQTFSGPGLLTSPLTGSDQGRSYIYAQTSQAFDEVRFTLNAAVGAISTLRVYYAMTFDPDCGNNENNGICDDAIQGAGTVVTYNGGIVCALCDLINGSNLIDANKDNYALLSTPAGALATVSVGVLDEQNIYPAGYRAGFVIGPDQANVLLDANLLNTLVVETYLFGTLQESQTFTSGGGLLSVGALSASLQQKIKLGFVTTLKFNEVRLRVNQPVGASLGGLRVYYAFEEPASCNDCQEALTSDRSDPYTGTIVTGSTWTTAGGLTLDLPFPLPDITLPGDIDDQGNVVNPGLTDYATYTPPVLGIGQDLLGLVDHTDFRLTVDNSPTGDAGPLFPAGTFGGFVIQKEGGLVDVGLLGAITISLYNGTTFVESQTGFSLAAAGALTVTGGKTVVGFKSTAPFNRIRISINNGLLHAGGFLGSSYRIYYAFVVQDTDGDGIPDCLDCATGPNSGDIDGDGIADACDNCNVGTAAPSLGATTFTNSCPSVTVDLSTVTAGNLPAGTQLTFHTGTPATGANKIGNTSSVAAGTYYAAIYDPVNDCYGPTRQITVAITVCPSAPLAEADHTATIKNNPVSGDLSTNDSDPQNLVLTYNTTATTAPSNGAIVINADGTFTYTPNNGFVGVDSFQYTVCNTAALCSTAWAHVAVSNPNTPGGPNNAPLAENDYSQTLTGVAVTGDASSNDIDPDGNTLTYTLLNNTSNGNLVLNPDGSYTYTPNPGTTGKDTARYQVCDNGTPSQCDEALIIIEVKPDENGPDNDAPFAQNDVAATPAGTAASGNVLDNDSDPNGDPLTATLIGSLTGLTLNPDGTFTYNPPAGFTGTVSVPYQACDGGGKCDTATLTITVLPSAPLAEADHTATIKNTPVNGDLSTNDSDPQNSALTYNTTATVAPSNGSVTINADGTFTYTPNNGFVGVDSFQYTVCNAAALCSTAWAHIAVSNPNTPGGVNNAPLAENDYSQTLTGVAVTGDASSNDIDPDGNTLTYTLLDNTNNGSLVLNPNGSYTYTPNPGTTGKDTARYQVCDNGTPSQCDEALIIIEVKPDTNGPDNDAPFAQNDVVATPAGTAASGNVLDNDSDPNGDPLTASPIGTLPPGLTFNPDGTFNYNPPAGFTGTVSVPYQACDGGGKCDTATLTIVVLPQGAIDLTPTTRVASSGFAVADQTENGIVIDVSEILGSQTNNAATPIQVRILKSSSFTYTYDAAATSANAPFPITVNNPDWELTTNTATQMVFTLKPGKDINGGSFSSFVLSLKVQPGAAKGTANFNVGIIAGSGNEIDFTNNQVVRILNIF